jgi:TPR repeat protein
MYFLIIEWLLLALLVLITVPNIDTAEASDHDLIPSEEKDDYDFSGVAYLFEPSVENFIKAAEKGDAHAQLELGEMYYEGKEVIKDYDIAYKWYKKAADQGDADAQYKLGCFYCDGIGPCVKDYKEAVQWFKKSAEQGNLASQVFLGTLYSMGIGVIQNYVQAHFWLSLVIYKGCFNLIDERDAIESKMTPEQIEQAQKMAKEWITNHS